MNKDSRENKMAGLFTYLFHLSVRNGGQLH